MARDVLSDVSSSWVAWLELMADHAPGGAFGWIGDIPTASVGKPMPLFNQAFVLQQPSVEELRQATRWMAERNVPFWVTAPASLASAVAEIADAVGLEPSGESTPGMALMSLAGLSRTPGADVEIVPVTEAGQLEAVAAVISDAFGAPLDAARPASEMLEDRRVSWFVGHLDGEPAACGQLLCTGDVAGVYTIGVRERYRRRGLGEAISRAVLAAGRDQGCEIGVLQASPMGTPVYEQMGFETVTQYHHFVPAG